MRMSALAQIEAAARQIEDAFHLDNHEVCLEVAKAALAAAEAAADKRTCDCPLCGRTHWRLRP
jgi:hypothetical protein